MNAAQSPLSLRDENNFDLIRLLLACVVFAAHAAELSGMSMLAPLRGILRSDLAIDGFFVLSGFLIFASYENSATLKGYFVKRARRILPAYFAVVLLCAFGLVFVSSLPPGDYFSADWLNYLAANLSMLNFLQPELPGVFEDHAVSAVNGALWTLKIELMFYLSVPLLAWFAARFGRFYGLVTIYLLAITWSYAMNDLASRTGNDLFLTLEHQLPGQLAFFISGALLFYFFDRFKAHASGYLLLAMGGMLLSEGLDWYWIHAISLAVIVIYLGLSFPYLGNWGRFGDLSYGVYIWHFPIIQLFVHFDSFERWPLASLAGMPTAVFGVAFLSWHLIEKPFLSRRSHYREAARGS